MQFEVNGERVTIRPSRIDGEIDWSGITISEAGNVVEICNKSLPKNVRRLYELQMQEQTDMVKSEADKLTESITDEQRLEVLPSFYGEIIKALSDISDDSLSLMNRLERTVVYDRYCLDIVLGLLGVPNFKPTGIKDFRFKGTKYYIPKDYEAFGTVVPANDMQAKEFNESADLEVNASKMSKGRWQNAALICGIICRPNVNGKREEYNKKDCIERAKIFHDLPLNVALEVFFCCIGSLDLSAQTGRIWLSLARESLDDGHHITAGNTGQ